MCGITGVVDLSGLPQESSAWLDSMVRSLRHRGPDSEGKHFSPQAALGHTRLSIIDVSSGQQPMCNEDGTVWITFNGEIYNFHELRQWLVNRGHIFKSQCDTEVVLHLFEEHGDRCVEALRGMFAFAIWDQKTRQLFLARDRLGIKPLYYAQQGEQLVFGSEIKSLLPVPWVNRDLNPEALQDYLTYLWIPAPKTIYRDVFKLPAGCCATFRSGRLALREYWDLQFHEIPGRSEESLREEFRERLLETVRAHLVSDVPLGAFLSGGLDSSAVVASMARLNSRPLITSSIGFDDQNFDELQHARRVAERFQTEHHEQEVTAEAQVIFERLAWHFDEPFADSSAVPTYYVSQTAREHVKVALSGDGGDENMAGYRKYKLHQRERMVRRCMPSPLRRLCFSALARLYPKADWLPQVFRAKSTFENLSLDDPQAIFLSRSACAPQQVARMLSGDLRRTLGDYDSSDVITRAWKRCTSADALSREQYVDIKTYLVDDILTKVDRASMAVALEVRVPLLDHRFVEFMASIPSKLKLRGGRGKHLFKDAVTPWLGSATVNRRKQGFSVPLDNWLRGPLKPLVEDLVFSPQARVQSWLDMQELRADWRLHQNRLRSAGSMFWAVLMLEQWARTFDQGTPAWPAHDFDKPAARGSLTAPS